MKRRIRFSPLSASTPSFANSLSLAFVSSLALLGAGCGDDGDDGVGGKGPTLRPGDICSAPQPPTVRARFSPERVFVPACQGEGCVTRTVRLVVEPDFCDETPVSFTSSDNAALPAPAADTVGLYKSEVSFELPGSSAPGRHTITASVPRGNGETATATLDVVVLGNELPGCDGSATDSELLEGETLAPGGGLAGASIGLQVGANAPQSGSFLWAVQPFAASLACGSMALPDGVQALGPAVTFGPNTLSFQRDIPLSIPVNPALLPQTARLRHLTVMFSNPQFPIPRAIPIADPHFVEMDGVWALSFKAPRLGTYQAVVREDAGKRTFSRHLTHRAVTGVSMGGMGSSMFGTRHHDLFDVVAPLGGPASWSWLINYIKTNHLAGFREIPSGTQLADIQLTRTLCNDSSECLADETCLGKTADYLGRCSFLPKPTEPYEHPQIFLNWWNEYPREGTGGSFPRQDYAQIFRDLALLMGNPNGDNLSPGGENLPPGVPPTHPSVFGDRLTDECATTVDPIDGHPSKDLQDQLAKDCPKERCANTLSLSNYFDREFNPDGTFPVITVCDGTATTEAESPYANAWKETAPNDYPLEVGLAVDYNGNGVRDELEPIIQSGNEPWSDTGADGMPSSLEAGYQLGVNEDPSGDDYHPQYNPGGTENNFRYDLGEPFEDVGMDGVAGTLQQPADGYKQPGDGYDVGEGDGVFTASRGLRRMWQHDPTAVLRGEVPDAPGGPMTDEALDRLDVWTDGGTRDIFNFHLAASHMNGAMSARGRNNVYYTDFAQMPGYNPDLPNDFTPSRMPWEDVPGSVMLRYGMIDPTAAAIENGNGQHVGTVNQIAWRLQTALYFIGSRWPQPELRTLVAPSNDNANTALPICQIDGACTDTFTDSKGRTGPFTVNLPPGYGHVDQADRRYPVIYLLHGYGMTPEDLGAAIVFITNWMNNPADSMSTRLPKAIVVYVDGRCRVGPSGKAECIKGNFFTNSGRPGGLMAEDWWLDLMQHIDQTYRTLGPTDVTWTP